jgi:F420-0:gamma-glutamyl ligase
MPAVTAVTEQNSDEVVVAEKAVIEASEKLAALEANGGSKRAKTAARKALAGAEAKLAEVAAGEADVDAGRGHRRARTAAA